MTLFSEYLSHTSQDILVLIVIAVLLYTRKTGRGLLEYW